jgi:hypothetical protein
MKKFFGLPALAFFVGFLLLQITFSSCTKDPVEQSIPVVNAGRDTTIHLTRATDSIQLNGSATDADGSIVAYSWDQVSGPNTATIANTGSKQTWVSHLITGTYVFQLMATDDDGNTGVKTVAITITAPPRGQTVPIVNAGRDTAYVLVNSSDSIKLNGSATDDDGIVVGYSWTQVSGPNASVISNPGSKTTGVKNLVTGSYVYQLTATDNDGNTGVKTVTITVTAPAKPLSVPKVDAGRDTTWHLASGMDTIHLNGIATDEDGTIVAYLWSQVSGPNGSVITNPGSRTTSVRNLVNGTYVFQLMATDNDGNTGVKNVTITVAPIPTFYLLTLQPNNNPNEVLVSYIDATGDNSYAHHPQLDADAWTTGGSPHTVRGIFKMDLSGLPANAKIVSAKLSLYSTPNPVNGNLVNPNFGTDNAMYIQRVTSDWNTTVKFATLPSTDAVGQILIPHTNFSSFDLIDVDVTNQVKSMVQTNNYGWIIRLVNESIYNSRQFASSWHSDVTKHPKLVIEYTF